MKNHALCACLLGSMFSMQAQNLSIQFIPSGNSLFSFTTLETLTFSGTNLIVREKTGVTEVISLSHINFMSYPANVVTSLDAEPFSKEVKVYPNPSAQSFTFENIQEGSTIEIFDVQGKMLRSLTNTAVWDGSNSQGHKVPSGMYTCRVLADQEQQILKVILK